MKTIISSISTLAFLILTAGGVFADVTVRQKMTMSGQSFETTKKIKGSRQRTEQKSGVQGAPDFMAQVATITQCDLRRTVQVNDGRKMYFVEPFAESGETDKTPVAAPTGGQTKRAGGTVTITLSVTDTGERQTLFGLPARRLVVVHETESSADSCGGAHRSKMEIDGWYVDFAAEFSCPFETAAPPARAAKPDCRDRVVARQKGAGKIGFLLNGTTKFYDEAGRVQMTQTLETIELSRATLAASLFDVPADYRLAASQQDLYAMPNVADLMRQQQQQSGSDEDSGRTTAAGPNAKTVGVNVNLGGNGRVDQAEINRYLAEKLSENELRPTRGAVGADYVLNLDLKQVKESAAGKVGGLFGKVTGIDTKTGAKVEVELTLTLVKTGSTAPAAQSRVAKKFDGGPTEAVKAAINEAIGKIFAALEN